MIIGIILTAILRIFGSFVDGMTDRPPGIGWWEFHVPNLLRRDVIIAIIYVLMTRDYLNGNRFQTTLGNRRFNAAMAWIIAIGLNYLLHHVFYALGFAARN